MASVVSTTLSTWAADRAGGRPTGFGAKSPCRLRWKWRYTLDNSRPINVAISASCVPAPGDSSNGNAPQRRSGTWSQQECTWARAPPTIATCALP
eukprot:9385374-Pyramimonas_sp.AAC.1